MKALTVCQPYAELIASGAKPIENRSWPTRYRGALVIHAGKSRDWLEADDERAYPDMAFGAVVAVAQLVACLPLHFTRVEVERQGNVTMSEFTGWPEPYRALQANEHANGPWCWVLEDVVRLPVPIPCRGMQGLWDVDARLEAQIAQALG
jgi:hypothetical protein